MDKLDFSKYKRFFAFGCSFTKYRWPTWADIISLEIPKSYNYGRCGAGNRYIVEMIYEADYIHKFNNDDLIIVMFTNVHREDRFIDSMGGWQTPGNMYSQGIFDDGFMKYFDNVDALMRDLSLIRGAIHHLENKKLNFHLTSMVPIFADLNGRADDAYSKYYGLFGEMYAKEIAQIKPSVFDVIFGGNWHCKEPRATYRAQWTDGKPYTDNHAHPEEHLEYIYKLWPNTVFMPSTIDYVNKYNKKVLNTTWIENHFFDEEDFVPDLPAVSGHENFLLPR